MTEALILIAVVLAAFLGLRWSGGRAERTRQERDDAVEGMETHERIDEALRRADDAGAHWTDRLHDHRSRQ